MTCMEYSLTVRELGAQIRNRRVAAGMTQDEVAKASNVSRQWLIRLEQGHDNAELHKVLAVVGALGLAVVLSPKPVEQGTGDVDLDQLLGGIA